MGTGTWVAGQREDEVAGHHTVTGRERRRARDSLAVMHGAILAAKVCKQEAAVHILYGEVLARKARILWIAEVASDGAAERERGVERGSGQRDGAALAVGGQDLKFSHF